MPVVEVAEESLRDPAAREEVAFPEQSHRGLLEELLDRVLGRIVIQRARGDVLAAADLDAVAHLVLFALLDVLDRGHVHVGHVAPEILESTRQRVRPDGERGGLLHRRERVVAEREVGHPVHRLVGGRNLAGRLPDVLAAVERLLQLLEDLRELAAAERAPDRLLDARVREHAANDRAALGPCRELGGLCGAVEELAQDGRRLVEVAHRLHAAREHGADRIPCLGVVHVHAARTVAHVHLHGTVERIGRVNRQAGHALRHLGQLGALRLVERAQPVDEEDVLVGQHALAPAVRADGLERSDEVCLAVALVRRNRLGVGFLLERDEQLEHLPVGHAVAVALLGELAREVGRDRLGHAVEPVGHCAAVEALAVGRGEYPRERLLERPAVVLRVPRERHLAVAEHDDDAVDGVPRLLLAGGIGEADEVLETESDHAVQ